MSERYVSVFFFEITFSHTGPSRIMGDRFVAPYKRTCEELSGMDLENGEMKSSQHSQLLLSEEMKDQEP